MDLQKDSSLKRLALLSWCVSFWNRHSVNREVQRIIDDIKDSSGTRKLIALAKNELKAMDLPSVIYDELIQRITWFGERVVKWYRRCSNIGVPWRCIRKIHWTIFGTIDEAKTVKKNFLGPDVALRSDSEIYGVYYMACICALKDYINRNATEIIDFCRWYEKDMENRHRNIPLLYRSVFTLANPESLNLSIKEKNKLISKYFGSIGCSKEVFMFELSVSGSYTAAAEYYWRQLNPLEKEDKLMNAAVKWIPDTKFGIDVLVFLLSEMSENQRETFFGYIVEQLKTSEFLLILRAFMESCAWEDHFFLVFYLLEDLKEHKKEYYRHMLNWIIYSWKSRLTVGLDAKNPVYKQMFLAVWGRLKTFHPEDHHFDSWFVQNVFKLFDIDVFNSVLEKYRFRQEFLEMGRTRHKDLLMENQFVRLKDFMGTVLTSQGERDWFKSELISNLDDVIRKHKFYVADNLLNWLSNSKEERQKIKFKFNFLSLCAEYFVNKNLTSATELITWGFSNEQEKDQYIDSIESSDLDWLHIILRRNNNWLTSLSNFLQLFFDTKDKYVGRKIAKLLTEDALRRFFIKIVDTYRTNCSLKGNFVEGKLSVFGALDKLMEFCLPLEDGPKLKMKIAENAGKWLLHLAQRNLCWGFLDVFLNWVSGYEIKGFEDEKTILGLEKKRQFVQRFLLSADGIKFLEIISTAKNNEPFERYAYLLVEWVGGVGVMENYMNELEALNLHDPEHNFKYASLKNMLKSFKHGDVQYETLEHVCGFQVNLKSGRCKKEVKIHARIFKSLLDFLMRIFSEN